MGRPHHQATMERMLASYSTSKDVSTKYACLDTYAWLVEATIRHQGSQCVQQGHSGEAPGGAGRVCQNWNWRGRAAVNHTSSGEDELSVIRPQTV